MPWEWLAIVRNNTRHLLLGILVSDAPGSPEMSLWEQTLTEEIGIGPKVI